jgi:hypothetical protein
MFSKQTDSFEHMDDLFKQLNTKMATEAAGETPVTEAEENIMTEMLAPRVSQIKEDVLYLANPGSRWSYGKVLSL